MQNLVLNEQVTSKINTTVPMCVHEIQMQVKMNN